MKEELKAAELVKGEYYYCVDNDIEFVFIHSEQALADRE